MTPHDDFAFEPIAGLPGELPEGENILWRGTPEPWQLGHAIFHTRIIALFFAVLAVSSVFSGLNHGATVGHIVMTFVTLCVVGAAIIGFAMLAGWLIAINTVYTITDKRLVIRHGVTLPMAINVPFATIATASAKIQDDGSGDVSVCLRDGERLALYAVWPHNRPWSWQGTAPAIRCAAQATAAARVLSEALAAYAAQTGDAYQRAKPKIQIRTRPHAKAPGTASAANA